MSLEDLLKANTEALQANTAALLKGGGKPAEAATGKAGKAGKKGPTLDAVKVIAEKMAEATDKPAVRKLLQKIGKVKSTAELDPKHFAAFITAAEAAIKEAEDDDDDDDDDDGNDDDDDDD